MGWPRPTELYGLSNPCRPLDNGLFGPRGHGPPYMAKLTTLVAKQLHVGGTIGFGVSNLGLFYCINSNLTFGLLSLIF